MTEKVLVVDDEAALRETLAYNLNKEGYQVDTVEDGPSAIEKNRTFHPDVIVLDIMLPGMDGFEVCRHIRQESNTPILMLTARDDEIDRVVGLEVGADDYLTKPFSMRELIARVKALLRRIRMIEEDMAGREAVPDQQQVVIRGNLEINTTRREVSLDGKPLDIKPKEYELLLYLAQHTGQMLSREMILENVWGWEYFGESRTVDVHIRWLREKIEKDPAHPARLVTVRSAGYRFEG